MACVALATKVRMYVLRIYTCLYTVSGRVDNIKLRWEEVTLQLALAHFSIAKSLVRERNCLGDFSLEKSKMFHLEIGILKLQLICRDKLAMDVALFTRLVAVGH